MRLLYKRPAVSSLPRRVSTTSPCAPLADGAGITHGLYQRMTIMACFKRFGWFCDGKRRSRALARGMRSFGQDVLRLFLIGTLTEWRPAAAPARC